MGQNATEKALLFLQSLVNKPLHYGIKSPDLDLYDFGFGDNAFCASINGKAVCPYVLHVTCRFKIMPQSEKANPLFFYEDTSSQEFHTVINKLIGLDVKRVSLSTKNDLWLDFDDYWIVFVTTENGEESWRFFLQDADTPHLVASNSWLLL